MQNGINSFQTPRGKIPAEVARRAKQRGLPVIALAGTVGPGASATYESGIDAFASIMQAPTSLEDAIRDTQRLLKDSAEGAMRMVMVGALLKDQEPPVSGASSADSATSKSDVPKVAAELAATAIPILKEIKVPEHPRGALDAKTKGQSALVTA